MLSIELFKVTVIDFENDQQIALRELRTTEAQMASLVEAVISEPEEVQVGKASGK